MLFLFRPVFIPEGISPAPARQVVLLLSVFTNETPEIQTDPSVDA